LKKKKKKKNIDEKIEKKICGRCVSAFDKAREKTVLIEVE